MKQDVSGRCFHLPSVIKGVAPTASRQLATKSMERAGKMQAITGCIRFTLSISHQAVRLSSLFNSGVKVSPRLRRVALVLSEVSMSEPSARHSMLFERIRSLRVPMSAFRVFLNIMGLREFEALYFAMTITLSRTSKICCQNYLHGGSGGHRKYIFNCSVSRRASIQG